MSHARGYIVLLDKCITDTGRIYRVTSWMVFFSMNFFDCFSRLQLEFTDDPAVLEGEGRDDEAEVEEKH